MTETTLSFSETDNDDFEPELYNQSKYYTAKEAQEILSKCGGQSNFSVLNVNARSLIKHFNEYELFLTSFNSKAFNNFDVLSFTETWLDSNLQQLTILPGYNAIFKHKEGRKQGGGLAIYVKQNIQFIERTDMSFPQNRMHLYDCLFIK